MVSFCWRS